MRRLLVVLSALIVACSSAGELAPTTSAAKSVATTPTLAPTTTGGLISTTSTTANQGDSTTTTGPRVLEPLIGLEYQEIATIDFPIHLVARPGDDNSYLATKDGRVWLVEGGAVHETLLDIRDKVRDSGEQGLLSLAVKQDDPDHLYLHYSAKDGATVVSEFTFISQAGSVDPESERVLLQLDQPARNHNGGMIQFGPDGGLYLGLGDGGGRGDRFNNAQNRDTLLGGLLRIDVESGDAEFFQYGLRNPWRFWIDGSTVYVADVGQGAFEEISVAALIPNVNYGWPITEGLHCFRPRSDCDTLGLTLPVVEVPHGDGGTCSITGGVVYRGQAIPELDGTFFFSDYCGGYLRGLMEGEVTDFTDEVGALARVASFGLDGSGEAYVMTIDRLLRLVPVRG